MHEVCYGKSSRASESSCPGVIMCSFVKEWLWWMLIYSHILTIVACIWLHIVHRSRNCFEAPQNKKINRGNKAMEACCDSIHWHTTCNPRIIEANYNVQLADEVTPMLMNCPAHGSCRHLTAQYESLDCSFEYCQEGTIPGAGNGHWPEIARDSIEISRHSIPLTSSFGQILSRAGGN